MNVRGYLLIELLVASTLLSLAGSGLYTGLSQGLKIERMIRKQDTLYGPLRICWLKVEKDLRNTVSLKDYPVLAKQDEMFFPAGLIEKNKTSVQLYLLHIHYFLKDGNLIRSEEKLPKAFVHEDPARRVLLKNVESVRFQYAYLDEKEQLVFKSFWLEELYFGIPKAIKIEIKFKEESKSFTRIIAIPQGRWGHVQVKEDSLHES